MGFAQPYWLVLLLLIPALAWWEWRRLRGGGAALQFSSLRLLRAADPTWRIRLRWLPAAFRTVALALCILALARPQEHNVVVQHSAEGIDIMLVLDISTSMRARDFHP